MPLFQSFLDVEAGQPGADTDNMRLLRPWAPVVDPTRLRQRAQTSQRFVCGTALQLKMMQCVGLPCKLRPEGARQAA